MDMSFLKSMLIRHEGLKLKPYKCTAGHWTIGVGHNLDARPLPFVIPPEGITKEQALDILDADIANAIVALNKSLTWTALLDDVRRMALIDMTFNMGIGKLVGFKKMLSALSRGDYEEAGRQAKDSNWFREVQEERTTRIINMLVTGQMQPL